MKNKYKYLARKKRRQHENIQIFKIGPSRKSCRHAFPMNANYCHLPTEILQHIIEQVPSHPYDIKLRQENKEILFTCALVCKTWMLLSRRRFLSLYFPSGRIAIDADPREILSLNDLFRSPLCTLDPAWIKLLLLNRYVSFREDRTDFFASLSLLDARKFPSLRAIELDGNYQVRFHEDGGDDDSNVADNPVQPHLSPIKSLKILTGGSVSFEDIISVIHLFPSLEQLMVSSVQDEGHGSVFRHHPRHHHHHPFPNPPMSLRKLTLGTLLLPEMTRWMMSHPQDHLNISSFTLISSWWNNDSESDYLRSLLDGIGPSLEELVLKVVDYGPPFGTETLHPSNHSKVYSLQPPLPLLLAS